MTFTTSHSDKHYLASGSNVRGDWEVVSHFDRARFGKSHLKRDKRLEVALPHASPLVHSTVDTLALSFFFAHFGQKVKTMPTIKLTVFHTKNPESAKALIMFSRTISEFKHAFADSAMYFHAGVIDRKKDQQESVDKLVNFCKQFPDITVQELEEHQIEIKDTKL